MNGKCVPPIVIAACALLSACIATPHPGRAEGATPPQLQYGKKHILRWSRVESFGPVPTEKIEMGKHICANLDDDKMHYHATGFHPRAKALDGTTLPGGGYYCVGKKKRKHAAITTNAD